MLVTAVPIPVAGFDDGIVGDVPESGVSVLDCGFVALLLLLLVLLIVVCCPTDVLDAITPPDSVFVQTNAAAFYKIR